ncbi:MAG: hypothetical protein ACPG5B_08185 [Chitinophagales bacterium]
MKKIIFSSAILILCMCLGNQANAQQNYYKFRISPSVGTMLYYGDLTDTYPRVKNYSSLAYGGNLEASLSKTIGFRLSATKGEISYNDRTLDRNNELLVDNPNFGRGLNFKTDILDASASFVLYADNDRRMKDDAFIAPYLTVGFGITRFDVFADLIDQDGGFYNLSDETLEQDGDYETNVTELAIEGEKYDTDTWHIPVGIGLKFRVGDRWNLNFETNVKYALTDYLDDVSTRGDDNNLNDFYNYTSASLNYNFGLKHRTIKAPVFIADQYSVLNLTDSLQFNIDGLADSMAIEEPLSIKEQRKANKAAKKLAKKEKKIAKKQAKLEKKAKKASEKEARKAEKQAMKDALDICYEDCKELPKKKDRKKCQKDCKKEGFEIYLEKIKAEKAVADSTAATQKILTPVEQIKQQNAANAKLDSLENVIKDEKKAEEKSSGGIISDENSNGAGTKNDGSNTIVLPSGGGNNMSESDIKAIMNERDLQDLKLQMEIQKLQNNNNSSYDPTIEMYKLETDRLRQENSDTKILNKLDEIQNRLDRLERKGHRGGHGKHHNSSHRHDQTEIREIEIIKEIETRNDGIETVKEIEIVKEDGEIIREIEIVKEDGEIIKEIDMTNEDFDEAVATNSEVRALNREIESLKIQILEMKLEESGEGSAETEALKREIEAMKQQLEQQEMRTEEIIEEEKSSKKKKKRKKR